MKNDEIKDEELAMLNEIKRQQLSLMKELKDKHPSLYIEFLDELSKEDIKEIKMLCATEFLSIDKTDKAKKIFNEIEPKDANVYNGIGICYRREGDNEKAIEYFNKAIEYGDIEIPLINICEIYEENEEYEKEEKFLNEKIRKYEENALLHAIYSKVLFILGKFSMAEKEAKKAIYLGEEIDGYVQLFLAMLFQGKMKEAEKIANEFLNKYPDELYPYILLADLHLKKGSEEAEAYLEALYKKSKEPAIMEYAITGFLSIGNTEKAEQIVKEAIRLHSDMASFHYFYGIISMMKGENEMPFFEKAMKLSKNAEIYLEIANIYLTNGKFGEAMRIVDKAKEKYGENERIACMKGDILFGIGKIEDAINEYEKSLKMKENMDAYFGIISCYEEMEKYAKVDEIFSNLMEKYNDGWLWLDYASVLKERGEYDKALKICNEAYELFDDEELKAEVEFFIEEMKNDHHKRR